MFKTMTTEELQALKPQALKKHNGELKARLKELSKLEAKEPLTDELLEEKAVLEAYALDVNAVIEAKEPLIDEPLEVKPEAKPEAEAEVKPEVKNGYKPAPGTEKMVHLSIVSGKKFDPNTGKALSKPYTQLFSYSEWLLFKNHFRATGFSIEEVLYDPYGEAKDFVTEK